MIKHVVMWRLKPTGDKAAVAAEMKKRLEALAGRIDGLISINVGMSFAGGEYDVCLVSEHRDREALAVYADHPLHCEVKGYVHSVVEAREACDFEY